MVGCGATGAPISVDRMDVAIAVLTDGSLQVRERLEVRTPDSRAATLVRRSTRERHDDVFDVSATVDGRALPIGRGAGQIQPGSADALDVRIPIPAGAEPAHVVTLDYRVAGAVAVSGIRGRMAWQVLPAGRAFAVANASVHVTLPAGAALLQDPWVEEAGWQVARLPDGLRAEKRDVSAAESATVGAEFTVDTMAVAEPLWQVYEARTQEFIPAYVSAGLFLIVVGVGVVIMVRAQFPRLSEDPGATVVAVPDHLRRAVLLGRASGRGRARRERVTDLLVAGLADRDRVHAARGLRAAGLVVFAAGVAGYFVLRATLPEYGDWPQALSIGLLADGVLLVIAGARLPILSQAGLDAAARLRDRRDA